MPVRLGDPVAVAVDAVVGARAVKSEPLAVGAAGYRAVRFERHFDEFGGLVELRGISAGARNTPGPTPGSNSTPGADPVQGQPLDDSGDAQAVVAVEVGHTQMRVISLAEQPAWIICRWVPSPGRTGSLHRPSAAGSRCGCGAGSGPDSPFPVLPVRVLTRRAPLLVHGCPTARTKPSSSMISPGPHKAMGCSEPVQNPAEPGRPAQWCPPPAAPPSWPWDAAAS